MRGLDPRIHRKKRFIRRDGWQRNLGLPEFRNLKRRKSGRPGLRVKPGHDGG
jgi:hypothetical protein